MATRISKSAKGRIIAGLSLLGSIGLLVLFAAFLKNADVILFNPKGFIANEQYRLLLISSAILLAISVPTVLLFYFFAWKYRETNEKATYEPQTGQGKFFVASIWIIPTLFMLVLAIIMWPATHKLAPQKSIASETKPLTIQVVALRWKWLFIYPEHNIATVNYMPLPVDRPVQFEITADEAPMSGFWIPHLSGQLYAMTGHVNRLNIMAEEEGDYPGRSAEINGEGFSGMLFTASAKSHEKYDAYISEVKRSSQPLDTATYQQLLTPSENHPTATYSQVEDGLYGTMLKKYNESHDAGGAHDSSATNEHAHPEGQ